MKEEFNLSKKREQIHWIINIIIGIMIIVMISIMVILMSSKTQDEIILYCYNQNWEGNITGEMDINCNEVYNKFFKDGQWVYYCSVSPFSPKPSCNLLCNIDCEIYNKNNNEEKLCVC